MTVSNFGSDQSSKLLMKRSCILLMTLFIKIHQKTKKLVVKLKYHCWAYIARHQMTFLVIRLCDNVQSLSFEIKCLSSTFKSILVPRGLIRTGKIDFKSNYEQLF